MCGSGAVSERVLFRNNNRALLTDLNIYDDKASKRQIELLTNTITAQVKIRTIYTLVPGSEDNRFAEITNSRVHIDIFWRSYIMERIWNRLELVGSRMKTNPWWV